MKIRRYIWLFFLLAIWMGCEEPVDLDIIPDQEKLVVISNFSDIDTLEVVVTKTISVLSQETATYLSDAIVEVFEGEKLVDRLNFVSSDNAQIPSYYRSNFLVPERGITYTIKVEAPGFDPVMAFNFIPEKAIGIDTNTVSFEMKQVDQDVFRTLATFDISVTIQDPPEPNNF
ncbi:MAG: DUF4249 domain-containing protein, partial [Phaeodactylibacter sp.]|nr:DUF4249 domain-containing protein [Phaeodactylibacter sp.]